MSEAILQSQRSMARESSQPSASLWLDAWRRLKRNKVAVASLVFIVGLLIAAVFAPQIAPYPYDQPDFAHLAEGSSPRHLLGTDHLGRDLLSRLVYGARISLMVGFLSVLMGLSIGVPLGLLAGYRCGWFDMVLMRIIDVLYAFPDLLFIILILTYIRGMVDQTSTGGGLLVSLDQTTGGLLGVLIGIAIVGWLTVARIVRAQVLSLRECDYICAARSTGNTMWGIMRRHLLPNTLPPLIIYVTLAIPGAMMFEASLSFLGLGVRPPLPSWGMMISEGLGGILSYPHLLVWPSVTLSLTMLAFNFLGDGLRDAMDPTMR